MRIDLPIDWDGAWKDVEADIVDVGLHVAHIATFAVHKYPEPWHSKWAVSNVETGLRISFGKTRREAIENAKLKLADKSAGKVAAALRKAAKRHA